MEDIFAELCLIVSCSAALVWLCTLGRQPLIVAYLLCGVIAGPQIKNTGLIDSISLIGVTLLLFLAGLVLHPDRLIRLFKSVTLVVLVISVVSWLMVFGVLQAFGFSQMDSTIAGLALMFSSTILVVKLLPTTALHQQHMGSLCIAILIAQDILAVIVMLFLRTSPEEWGLSGIVMLHVKAVALIAGAVMVEQWVLRKMMRRVDRYHEVLVMLCMGWCLGLSWLAHHIDLSYEIGAFVAGVVLARNPISRFLSGELKTMRDFFLMFFFFVLGARLDLFQAASIWIPVLVLTALILVSRPVLYRFMFKRVGEPDWFSKEAGIRLGQGSEFALIIAFVGIQSERINDELAQLIQMTAILTMIVSSYIVIYTCPTPLGTRKGLKKD